MPSTNEGVLLFVGAIFFLIGLLGGGFEISAIKILPSVGKYPRLISGGIGIIFMGIAVIRFLFPPLSPQPTTVPTVPVTSTIIAVASTETPIPPTHTPVPPTDTPFLPTNTSVPIPTDIPTSRPTSIFTSTPTVTLSPTDTPTLPPPPTPKVMVPTFPFKVNGNEAEGGRRAVDSGKLEIEIGMISKYNYSNPYLMFDSETLYNDRYFWQTKVSEFEPKFVICLPEPVKGVLSIGNVTDLSIPDLREAFPCR